MDSYERGDRTAQLVRARYERAGWKPLHRGPPDYLMIKRDPSSHAIIQVCFVEAKTRRKTHPRGSLERDQKVWVDVLLALGLDVRVEHPGPGFALALIKEEGKVFCNSRKMMKDTPEPESLVLDPGQELLRPIKRRSLGYRTKRPDEPALTGLELLSARKRQLQLLWQAAPGMAETGSVNKR